MVNSKRQEHVAIFSYYFYSQWQSAQDASNFDVDEGEFLRNFSHFLHLTSSIFFCCIHFLSLLSPTLLVHHLSLFQESKSSKVVSAYATIGCCFQSLILNSNSSSLIKLLSNHILCLLSPTFQPIITMES